MFDSLKKKLSGWLGFSKKEETKEVKKVKKEKKVKEKQPKEKKQKPSKKEKIQKNDLEVERKVSQEVIEDIRKEKSDNEINSIPQLEEIPNKNLEAEIKEEREDEAPKKGFFSNLFSKVSRSVSSYKITQADFEENFAELEIILLENNVALEVVDKIKENLAKSLINTEVKKLNLEEKIISSLKEAILSVLIEPPNLLNEIKKSSPPYVILFFGINGSGKTTSIAKLAHYLKKNKVSLVMAAADTFRAASIEQLSEHASRLGVPLIKHSYGSDPAAVAFDAISYAKKNNLSCVLIDTAGRMYTKSNLLKEMEKIIRISKPNLKIFVGEAITGNDATEQAKTFNETCGIEGIILSKADIDDKAGAILSVSFVTNKPIYFLGTGQSYEDLRPFTKAEVLKNIGLE